MVGYWAPVCWATKELSKNWNCATDTTLKTSTFLRYICNLMCCARTKYQNSFSRERGRTFLNWSGRILVNINWSVRTSRNISKKKECFSRKYFQIFLYIFSWSFGYSMRKISSSAWFLRTTRKCPEIEC